MRYLILIFIFALLAGCVGKHARIAAMSHDEMSAQPTLALCEVYGNPARRNETIKSLLTERNAVKPNEWELINDKAIAVGMGTCSLLASWGKPHTINPDINGRDEWVYRNPNYGNPYRNIYVQSGKIVAGDI